MSRLKKKRDELADAWWEKINTGMGVSLHATSIYKHGFDAAVAELRPEIDKLVAALDHINGEGFDYCECCSNFGVSDDAVLKHYDEIAVNALTSFKQFMGDGE